MNQISQMVRERTGEAYMADCTCTGSRIARFVDLIGGFSDSAVSRVRCCLQHVKTSIACQSSLPQLDVIRCQQCSYRSKLSPCLSTHLVSGSSGSLWFKGGFKHYSPKTGATQLDAIRFCLGSASSRFFGFLGGFEHLPPKAETTQLDAINCRLGFACSGLFGSIGGFAHPYSKAEANHANDDQTHRQLRNDRDHMPDASDYMVSAMLCQSLCSTKMIASKQTPKLSTEKFRCNNDEKDYLRTDTKLWRPVDASCSCKCCEPHFRGFRLFGLLKGFFFLGLVCLQGYVQRVIAKQTSTSTTKAKLPKNGDIAHPRLGGERQQQDASANTMPKSTECFVEHGRSCFWEKWVCSLLAFLLGGILISSDWGLQGGMLNQVRDEGIVSTENVARSCPASYSSSLESCAHNLLIADCINRDSIQILLEHPEAPWIQNGDGFQITLGAARLSLTKASSMFPNFTKVITAFMSRCNRSAYGSTIVINKNLQTNVHIDSRNEKLPAFLTAITDYQDGELFLKSEYGSAFFKEHKGFMMHIPVGGTIAVPTFKIPHATNYWKGTRIIMVLFTSPINRIDASKHNLRLQLQQLGFQIPEIDKSWVDCEITGNSYGNPIFSKPTSIRGFFTAGERRCTASLKNRPNIGTSDCEVWEISSGSEHESNHHITSTWPDLFDSQLSDIEHCSEDPSSPATTEIDTDSESQLLETRDQHCDNINCKKRKHNSIAKNDVHNQDHEQKEQRCTNGIHDPSTVLGRVGFSFQVDLEGSGDARGNCSRFVLRPDLEDSMRDSNADNRFGFDYSRMVDWSLPYDPIEACTDDEMNCLMSGGGAPAEDFQLNKADISKLVQKLKNVQHGLAHKQLRMLLISDLKFCKKIERTTDQKQLQNCVTAAAQRMGLQGIGHVSQTNIDASNVASSSRQKQEAHLLPTNDGKSTSGKGGLTAIEKGKGRGDIQKPEPKGRGKSKGEKDFNHKKSAAEHAEVKGKAKGKGKPSNITYSIDPDGWNVQPLTEFSNTHGGVYMCEKEEHAKRIAEKGVGRNYPIGVVAPFPMDIGVKQPESICIEFIKHVGDQSQKISMQAFLHQITYADVEYRKMAPAVNIQKPSIAKTSVCYLTFSDEGACAQTQIEMEQKRLPAIKQWLSSLAQHNRGLEILDVWNVQALQQKVNARTYQASVRVPSSQVASLLAMSGPGKLQVNVPGALRTNLQHVWLKKEGRPMDEEEVLNVMNENIEIHLGAFQVRGTWALRTLTEHHGAMKAKLGKNEDPAYFISNVPPEMETENIQEILQQLKWKATVKDGERRWKRAGYTWLVRASEDPKVWQFPITFGYERRTLKIEAARKPKILPTPFVPANTEMHFPTWNAQCRVGKLQPRNQSSKPSFAEVVNNAARKRHRPEVAPTQREDSENWSDIEEDADKTGNASLQAQLNDMMKQNSEQQQTIQQLLQQIQNLTAQVQALTAQNMAGGAATGGNLLPNPGNAS